MNKLLVRQLRRCFGDLDHLPEELSEFLHIVDQTYDHHDQDRLLVDRSLEISSEELDAVNSELRSIFKQFPDIYFRLDSNGLILDYLCDDHKNLFLAENDLIGKYIQNIPSQDISVSFEKAIHSIKKNQTKEYFEYPMEIKKKTHYFEASLIPIFQSQIIVFIVDITQQKSTEKKLEIAKEKAIQADKLKTAFLANMSHEIRSPMNSILGFAELLEDGEITPDERLKYTSIIKTSGNHLMTLISDIIDISKIEAGQLAIKSNKCILQDLINDVFELFRARDEYKKKQSVLVLEQSVPPGKDVVTTDSIRLKQVLINLLGNSLKFTERGGIEFGYALMNNNGDELIQFFVKDTGRGISKKGKSLVLERFTQDPSYLDTFSEGTGLGLSISKELVELLGGKMWFNSKEGIGSQFYFTIPNH